MIEIKIDDQAVINTLNGLAGRCSNLSPLMGAIAEIMHDSTMTNFDQQGRPAWLGYQSGNLNGRTLLNKTGHLKSSITTYSDSESALVGTNVKYAAIHQFGGRTSPHIIRPRHKKALAFNGGFYKKVNHPGSKIPARPFLKLTPDDEREIVATVQDYLQGALN